MFITMRVKKGLRVESMEGASRGLALRSTSINEGIIVLVNSINASARSIRPNLLIFELTSFSE
jgi:hypothetical protein